MIELEKVEHVQDLKDDEYYLYPSRDTSVGVVIKGEDLKDWLQGDLSNVYLTSTVTNEVLLTLFQVYRTNFIYRQYTSEWDTYIPMDVLIAVAYLASGKKLKKIKHGSLIHNKLRDLLIED